MGNLSITTTQVIQSTNASNDIEHGKSGEAITIGQAVYRKSSDNKLYLADADLSEAGATSVGIALSSATAANQSVSWQKSGTITIGAGASVAQGAVYCLSATAGAICPEADLTTGDYVTVLGVGNSSDAIVMPSSGPFVSGVAHV